MYIFPKSTNLKIPTNGVTLHVRILGDGPPLLLLHGWMGTSVSWRKVVEPLSQRFRVIVPDMRGYGESDKPLGGYDGMNLVEDLLGLLNRIGVDKCGVIGHDMGAIPALLLAASSPERVYFLGYVDEPLPGYNLDRFTAFVPENPFPYWWFGFNSQASLPQLMWQGKETELVDYFITSMCADPYSVEREAREEYVRTLHKPGGLMGSFGWYRDILLSGQQIKQATEQKITLPVLAVNGQYGHPDVGSQMLLVATDVTSRTIPNCGHLVPEEAPGEFTEILLDFAATRFGF